LLRLKAYSDRKFYDFSSCSYYSNTTEEVKKKKEEVCMYIYNVYVVDLDGPEVIEVHRSIIAWNAEDAKIKTVSASEYREKIAENYKRYHLSVNSVASLPAYEK